jgi:prophage DNA circulation protein
MTRAAKLLLPIGAMIAGLGAGYACNDKSTSASEARNEALGAQREADNTALEARREADKRAKESMSEATKKVEEANSEAREKIAKSQANANDTIRQAKRELGDQAAELRKFGQEKLDEVNHLIDDTKVKAQTAAPQVRSKVDGAIRDVELRRDALQSELASLEARADTTYDKAKDEINGRFGQLRDRIRQIARSL